MRQAINSLQKNVLILLLYSSAFFGVITDLAGGMSKTPFYAAFDAMMIILGMLSLNYLRARFFFIILFFFVCIIVNLSYSSASLYTSLNGFREILSIVFIAIFYNKVFAEGNEDLAEDCIEIVKKFGVVFLIAQIPVAFVQVLKYGPSDAVGGTFGDAGSGVLTFSVICIVYFMHHFTRNISQTILLYFTLVPLLLNETKISFVLIPMTILFIRFQPNLKNMLTAVGGAILFFFIFNTYYSHSSLDFDDNATGIFSTDFLDDYLLADIYTYDDIPRFTKIIIAWELLSEQTNTFLFGMEYGLFKGGSALGVSAFAETYQWLFVGTRPYVFFLMMQGGILLVAAFSILILHVNRFFKNNNKFKVYLFLLFLLILGYNDLFRNQTFAAIFFFLLYFANSREYEEKTLSI